MSEAGCLVVVYKVNAHEWLYTPINVVYHFNNELVDEIYQEEELATSFVIEPGAALDSLVGDGAMSLFFRNANNNH
jgi:hypothetical protein